jgi:FKBP-type peptidyl-prolyl cis-trans isomerase
MKRTFSLLMIAAFATLFGCLGNDNDVYDAYEQWKKDVAIIDKYLADNNITAVKDARGVRMVIDELGTGLPPITLNTVDVDYVGKLFSNGQGFDSGNIKGVLNGFIEGWQIALSTLPTGSKAKVYIPSPYAYQNTGAGSIPPNAILVFDVDFKGIVRSSGENDRFKTDTTAIDTYLAGKSINAITDTTGVRYVITSPGTGAPPTWYDKLKVSYSIKLLSNDGVVVASVDAEPNENFDSRVVDFVPGMMLGLQKIGEGGTITLYVPSGLAFGTGTASHNGVTVVPQNSNLIIEVTLTEIL